MQKDTIKRSITLDPLASVALDRLARHRRQTRQQVIAELIAEASRLAVKDMSPAEWKAYFGETRMPTAA